MRGGTGRSGGRKIHGEREKRIERRGTRASEHTCTTTRDDAERRGETRRDEQGRGGRRRVEKSRGGRRRDEPNELAELVASDSKDRRERRTMMTIGDEREEKAVARERADVWKNRERIRRVGKDGRGERSRKGGRASPAPTLPFSSV